MFFDRVSLCSKPGCPVDQAGLNFRDPPASACCALGLRECIITPGFSFCYSFVVASLMTKTGGAGMKLEISLGQRGKKKTEKARTKQQTL